MMSFIHLLALSLQLGHQDHSYDDGQHLAAHIHGQAELNIAVEQNQVAVEFISPAGNLLSFEHMAKTQAEKQQIQKTENQLNQTAQLFSFTGADCHIADKLIVMGQGIDAETSLDPMPDAAPIAYDENDHHKHQHEHHQHDHPQHDHQAHGHIHAKSENDKHITHAHKHDAEHTEHVEHNTHSEITASYQFHCSDTAKLSQLKLGFLDLFPGIETLNVIWLSADKQGLSALNAHNSVIRF
ncbi:DUF2796 domain-containing protein [Catenovulum sp. SM1970]|uniref:ZrgA family zinc uptake protein n=1 Tax=Marinifaba aquimaris TaxID=2741323 RepID=UPI001574B6D8|nr:DUF2796 domain-containing protein [Marinifaba aquimaris]NTS78197.1 DUF2796 domain-containing protein [Marinifaba aquimaris]